MNMKNAGNWCGRSWIYNTESEETGVGNMRNITIGILAHVDAGKTTLSESILYLSGKLRTLGRVDHKDAFLDTL